MGELVISSRWLSSWGIALGLVCLGLVCIVTLAPAAGAACTSPPPDVSSSQSSQTSELERSTGTSVAVSPRSAGVSSNVSRLSSNLAFTGYTAWVFVDVGGGLVVTGLGFVWAARSRRGARPRPGLCVVCLTALALVGEFFVGVRSAQADAAPCGDSPPAVVPETASAVVIPIAGALVLGGVFLIRIRVTRRID